MIIVKYAQALKLILAKYVNKVMSWIITKTQTNINANVLLVMDLLMEESVCLVLILTVYHAIILRLIFAQFAKLILRTLFWALITLLKINKQVNAFVMIPLLWILQDNVFAQLVQLLIVLENARFVVFKTVQIVLVDLKNVLYVYLYRLSVLYILYEYK